jgi:hypothetical protein
LNESLGRGKRDFLEWIAAINEKSAALDERLSYPVPSNATCLRMSPVESANPHGERKIVGVFALVEHERLNCDAAEL